MLMYRLVDPDLNQVFVDSESIPEDIKTDIDKENVEFQLAREKFKQYKDTLSLKVYYMDRPPEVVAINKNETMEALTVIRIEPPSI